MAKDPESMPSEKEAYNLWWEYLKRSVLYKAYCGLQPYPLRIICKEDGEYALDLAIEIDETNEEDVKRWEDSVEKMNAMDMEDVCFIWDMQRNWEFFGDIFKNSFDDWWEKRKDLDTSLPVIALNDPEIFEKLPKIKACYEKDKIEEQGFPSLEKIKEIFSKSDPRYIFLAVPMVSNVTAEDIAKQISSIRREHSPEPFYQLGNLLAKRFSAPMSRVRYDELKRYLQVYDLKEQGLKMKEIVAKIDPSRRGNDADVLRSFRSDLQKAKQVIDNVERGIFSVESEIIK